jgi:hypothetical protein
MRISFYLNMKVLGMDVKNPPACNALAEVQV